MWHFSECLYTSYIYIAMSSNIMKYYLTSIYERIFEIFGSLKDRFELHTASYEKTAAKCSANFKFYQKVA